MACRIGHNHNAERLDRNSERASHSTESKALDHGKAKCPVHTNQETLKEGTWKDRKEGEMTIASFK
ncbi:MAG: hypothetical protein HQL08_01650 [Nitrospirae bacterium]|nr:hypothetical protein [Nitrospirota bacterium]